MGDIVIERRFLGMQTAEIRADDDGRTLTGYAAVFDSDSVDLGGFIETIAPGAFARALKRSDVVATFNHDPSALLGRVPDSLRLWEDNRGLGYNVDLLADDPLSTAVAARVRRKDLRGSSFSFALKPDGSGEEWTTDEKGRVRRRIVEFAELFDVGPVTFPAYESTRVAARSLERAFDAAKAAGNDRVAVLIAEQIELDRLALRAL